MLQFFKHQPKEYTPLEPFAALLFWILIDMLMRNNNEFLVDINIYQKLVAWFVANSFPVWPGAFCIWPCLHSFAFNSFRLQMQYYLGMIKRWEYVGVMMDNILLFHQWILSQVNKYSKISESWLPLAPSSNGHN